MMKFLSLLISIVSLTALSTGCKKECQPERLEAIGLDVTELGQTKGAVTSAAEVVSLGIFGYSTGTDNYSPANPTHTPNLFNNRRTTRSSGGQWSYAPFVYWPIDLTTKNTFFAYSPHLSEFPVEANGSVSASTGYPLVTYTVPSLVSKHTDLLFSESTVWTTDINKEINDGKVLYGMKHALSWIELYIAPLQQIPLANESYSITSLSFTAQNFTTRATLNLGTGGWSAPTTGLAQYTYNVDGTPLLPDVVVPADANNCLMLIPQTITSSQNNPTVNVSFIFNDGSATPDLDLYSFSIPFPPVQLTAGCVSVFVLTISPSGVAIVFYGDNVIESWIEDPFNEVFEVY
ncbi:MAG: fimbrillin family protein [Prevotellaceae bacterium]|jgi:hypothetical protein|nr:fimbrillin family protein [Prevotellaceae bacterium]